MVYYAEIVLKNDATENVHLSVDDVHYVDVIKDGQVNQLGMQDLATLTIDVMASYRFVGKNDVLIVSGSALLAINIKYH